jgi:Tfp pilus assembly protein PilW
MPISPAIPRRARREGFSLVELLVAMAIVMVLLVGILSVLTQVSASWQRVSDKVDSFQDARLAFELLSTNLSRATLNTYIDYDNPQQPTRYRRESDLAFFVGPAGQGGVPGTAGTGQAVFFQLPSGHTADHDRYGKLRSLLNTCGYFIQFCQNPTVPAHVKNSSNPWRFRLMQLLEPTEKNAVHEVSHSARDWVAQLDTPATPIADNVIALIIRAKDPAASPTDLVRDYNYDSRSNADASPQPVTAHQLPPVLAVTMIVLDEKSALRIEKGSQTPAVIRDALVGKFTSQNEEQFQSDLLAVEEALRKERLNYRIYSSSISLKESKWSP